MAAWWMLSWELVGRYRLLFTLTAVYIVALCLVFPFLPAGFRSVNNIALFAGLPLMQLTILLAIASHGSHGELEARASAFPPRLFLLPVRDWVLVGAPLVLGSLITLAAWGLITLRVLWPCGATVGLWPGVLAAALVAWCQALSWLPFPLRWSRLVGLGVMVVLLGASAIALGDWLGDPFLIPLYLALTASAYVVAWTGIRLARHGVGITEPAALPVAGAAAQGKAPFASAEAAQFWMEVRLRVWLLLISMGTGLVFMLPTVHMASMLYSKPFLVEALGHTAAVEAVGIGWLAITPLAMMPVITAMFSGSDLGKLGGRRDRQPRFLLTLPLATATIVRIKRRVAFLGVALMWLSMALVAAGWAAVTGHLGDMSERLVNATGSVPAAVAVLLGVSALVIALSWLWMVSGLWSGLVNSPLVEGSPAVVGLVVGILTVTLARVWFLWPDWRWAVTAGVVVVLLAKAGLTAWMLRELWSKRLAHPLTLAGWLIGWLALALTVAWLACWFTNQGPTLFATVLVLMPLASALAAPLALDAGRHQ